MLKSLKGLSFHAEAADTWHRRGIAPLEGPRPSEAMIENRAALAALLLSAAERAGWAEPDRQQPHAALQLLEEARDRCIRDLPAVLRCCSMGRPHTAHKWAEFGREAVGLLQSTQPVPDEVLFTHHSTVLDAPTASGMGPQAVREAVCHLYTGGPVAFSELRHSGLRPGARQTLRRLAGC